MVSEESANLIDYILTQTDVNQAGLARKLKVSRAQISKWKAGDHISSERTSQLLSLAGLFDTVNAEWAMFAKSKENAEAWYAYVFEIFQGVEWGSSLNDFFHDMPDIYVGHLIVELCALGATIEHQAPAIRLTDEETYESTPFASVLFSLLEAWGQLCDWIDVTLDFDDLTNDAECELIDAVSELEWCAFDLALEYVGKEQLIAIGVDEVKPATKAEKARREVFLHLQDICRIRTKHGLPITENYFQLLYLPPVELAEQSWFRPTAENVDENAIKSYLPFGQQLIIAHLECSARALNKLDDKLNRVLEKLGS